MTSKRCYLDANVLISAWCGNESVRAIAKAVLDDPQRRLVVSDYVRLEVLPKPTFHRQELEIKFMETILSSAEKIASTPKIIERSIELAGSHDLSPLDALHLAAAAEAQVDELLTFERPEKPICRQKELPVVSLGKEI